MAKSRYLVVAGVVTLALVAGAVVFTGSSPAQEDDQAQAVLQTFLNTESEVGEESGQSLRAVLQFADVLEEQLIAILLEGPAPADLERFDAGLDDQWQARQGFLDGMDQTDLQREGLEADDAAQALAVTEEDYKSYHRGIFIEKQREKAAVALAAIGTDAALSALEVAAREANPDLAHVIDLVTGG